MLLLLTKDNAPCRVCLLRYPTDEFRILWAANVKLQLENFFLGPTYLSAVTLSSSRPHLIVKSLYCFGLTTLIVSHHHNFFIFWLSDGNLAEVCRLSPQRRSPVLSRKNRESKFLCSVQIAKFLFSHDLNFLYVLGPRRALTHFFSSINYDRWYFIMHLKKKLAVGLPFKVWRKFENLPTTQCLHATVCSVKPLGWHELISVIQFPESDSLIEMILLLGACLWNAINFVCQGVKRFYRKERLSKDGYPCSGNRRNKTPSALNSISFLSTCTVFAWMRNQYRDMILLIL